MKKGFTLIEIIVAIGLFGVSSVLGAGLLLSLTNVQNRVIAIRSTLDNLGFALEIMTKEIRTGVGYYCGFSAFDIPSVTVPPATQDCPGGGPVFTFQNAIGDSVTYRAENNQLQKRCRGYCGETIIIDTGFLPLTDPEVRIGNLKFYADGSAPADNLQPKVTVSLQASAGRGYTTEINLQATITQRKID